MKKIKRLISILIIILLFSFSTISYSATSNREGLVVEITHYNDEYPTVNVEEQDAINNSVSATTLLCEKIAEVTYAEILWFDVNKLYVGIPYSAVEKILEIDTVKEIVPYQEIAISTRTAEEKISSELKTMLNKLNSQTTVNLSIWFSYTPAIYYGFSEVDFTEPQDYLEAKRAVNSQYHLSLNNMFFDEIKDDLNIVFNSASNYTPCVYVTTTLSEVSKIANKQQVDSIEYISNEPTDEPSDEEPPAFTYAEKFDNWILFDKYNSEIDGDNNFNRYFDYYELYEHHIEDSGENDWALISAKVNFFSPFEDVKCLRAGNRILKWWQPGSDAHGFGLFVYDANEDTFYDIDKVNFDDYNELINVIEELELGGLLGDVDMDEDLTILDATCIQRYLANLQQYESYTYEFVNALSDVDADGEMSVMDATAIQRRLAKLDVPVATAEEV